MSCRLHLNVALGMLLAGSLLALPAPRATAAEQPKVTIRSAPPGKRPVTRVIKRTAPRSTVRTPRTRSARRAEETRSKPTRRTAARTTRTAEAEGRRVSSSRETENRTQSKARTAAPRTAASTRETGPITLNAQGFRLLRQGRFAEAEPVLRRAIDLKPSQPTYGYALYNLGWSLMGQGRVREAVEPLRRSSSMQPTRREPKEKLAEAYELLGQEDEAAELRASLRSRRSRRARDRNAREGALVTPAALPASPGIPVAKVAPEPEVRLVTGSAWVGSTRLGEDQGLRRERELRVESARRD